MKCTHFFAFLNGLACNFKPQELQILRQPGIFKKNCRYYDNNHLEVVKGFFLNSIYKEWGMTFHQASARFILGRIPLIDRRRSHLVANPDDTDDERDAELARARAAEQAADVAPGDVSGKVNCWT